MGTKRESMWNPESYRDTDYGLAEDEAFEPGEVDRDDPEPESGMPYIQTVLGRIAPEDAGLTLVHEHLYRESVDGSVDSNDRRLNDPSAALADLEAFFTVRGRTVVDVTIASHGRSAQTLQWLAQRAPVHIVATTGIDLKWNVDFSSQLETVEREVREGLDGTPVRPGLLVVRADDQLPPERDGEAISGMAAISEQFGLPLMMDIPPDLSSVGSLSQVINAGAPAHRLVVNILASAGDVGYPREIANSGAYVLFEGLGASDRAQDVFAASMVAELVRDGAVDRILLSHGYTRRSLLTGYGGRPGFGYIVEQFAIMLLEAGVAALDVRKMLVDNAASALSIRPRLFE